MFLETVFAWVVAYLLYVVVPVLVVTLIICLIREDDPLGWPLDLGMLVTLPMWIWVVLPLLGIEYLIRYLVRLTREKKMARLS